MRGSEASSEEAVSVDLRRKLDGSSPWCGGISDGACDLFGAGGMKSFGGVNALDAGKAWRDKWPCRDGTGVT
ncbi:hypothetical protein WG66_005445 [Moniliophthora roreri]|nr:hypothetical protein WG66_005445 [Moniliophthora roreri]